MAWNRKVENTTTHHSKVKELTFHFYFTEVHVILPNNFRYKYTETQLLSSCLFFLLLFFFHIMSVYETTTISLRLKFN